jgi:E3 ubiquitin-protein ligase MARCH6
MFHFALFVSMCRRILRTGVLYFIRDPDDPTFHPVRDVLERNVITQLRKIAFSAIVYGALIIICLGGIVWGLWAASDNVLPIHWSSTGSNIEFPLDILFYNFLTPFVVRYANPSAGITTMYGWWFKKVARVLRLSDFLFRDQKFDEKGHWVRHTWKAWFTRRINHDLTEEDVDRTAIAEGRADQDALDDGIVRFVPDGRFVRAPASDQVRIPKGTPVFVPVDSENKRLDGKPDDEGVHASSSNMVTKVYIPPWFKVRVGLFIVAVWAFAATTGVCVTVLPLLFGRYLLSSTFGPKEFINDIYAFSCGIYILGGALYAGLHHETILNWMRNTFIPTDNGRRILSTTWNGVKRIASLLYVYSALAIGLPLINALLLEVYILMPMHYFFDASEHHVMHLVQDWTLGILYVRIGMRIFLFDAESPPARAIRQVFAKGYFNPDARRATRFFILPALLGFAVLMGAPFLSAVAINKTYMRSAENEDKIAVMRMAYPIASAVVILMLVGRKIVQATAKWRARIKDEVYLVGERLHNFGERRIAKAKDKAKAE